MPVVASTLALAAGLALAPGPAAVPAPLPSDPPAVPAGSLAAIAVRVDPAPPTPKEVLRLPFSDVRRDQERGWEGRDVGGAWVGLRAALDPEARLEVLVRGHEAAASNASEAALPRPRARSRPPGREEAPSLFTLAQLEAGVELVLDGAPVRILLENGNLRLWRTDVQHTHVLVSLPGLVRSLHQAALRVLLHGVVEYAVLRQEAPVAPSVALLREDRGGTLWVTHRTDAELAKLVWIVSVDGTRYAMRIEGDDLVFFAKKAE